MTRTLAARDPRTGRRDFTFAAADSSQIGAAAARLRAAQNGWAARTIDERASALLRLADSIADARGAIGAALERDTGRRRIAYLEVDGVVASIRGWAAMAGDLAQTDSGWTQGRSRPEIVHAPQLSPFPLVGVISPWNFPLTLAMIDTIPALLAGCAVLVKPSEVTPRFIAPVAAAVAAAGLNDVLALMQGDGETGAAVVAHADTVCFTGSVATGRKVAIACAERLIPAFLELGGKDPLIVLASADIEAASDAALRGASLAAGQACQSIERIYVAHPIYDAFCARLAEKANAARLNWPDISQGEIGPIIFDRQADILRAHLDDAVAKGARILAGGEIERHGGGLWLRPTVVADATHDMALMCEETFGPIMPLAPFDTVEEAIRLANDSTFGLSAAVFAGALGEAEAVARRIDAGAISINDAALTAQFHEAEKHAFKQSGLGGSRMGAAGFHRFLRRKALIANRGAPLALSAFSEG